MVDEDLPDDEPEEEEPEEVTIRRPHIYQDENIGFGSTLRVIDFDRLDKN